MRTPEPTPSGAWKVRFRGPRKRGGHGQTSETFAKRRDAERFCRWLDALGAQGALDQIYAGEQATAVPTMDELAAQHIAHLTSVTDGTRLNYERLWARTWGARFGKVPVTMVGPDAIRAAVIALAGTYSHKSLKNQRGLLAGVMDRAIEQGHITKNPTKGIRLPRANEVEAVEMRILTAEEYLGVEDKFHAHYLPLLRFLAATGARWGEAVALTVADVSLPNVRIRRALKWSPDNERTVGPTKTRKSNRTVSIPADLHDELRNLCAGKPKTALVFTAPRGGPVQHRTFWSDIWLPAVKHLDPRPRIHDLRHSHASWLLGRGVPIHIVQRRLGHESIQTTVDTYGHLLPDAQAAASDAAALVFTPRRALGS